MSEQEMDEREETEKSVKSRFLKEVWDWTLSILIALAITFVIREYVVTLVNVEGTSMVPTLQNGDRLAVVRLFYKPQNGDIIIFNPQNGSKNPYVKRIIAHEGQTVEIDNQSGTVYVDGMIIDEEYINERTKSVKTHFEVPKGMLFVMGDNRGNSMDSRSERVGFVSADSVVGRAALRLWPPTSIGMLK